MDHIVEGGETGPIAGPSTFGSVGQPPAIRRMKSAGALQAIDSFSRPLSPALLNAYAPSGEEESIQSRIQQAPKRYVSLGRDAGKRTMGHSRELSNSIEELTSTDDGPPLPARRPSTPSTAPAPEKKGLVHMLRKMTSKGRMRSGSGSGEATLRMARPGPPLHSNTEPILEALASAGLGIPARSATAQGFHGNSVYSTSSASTTVNSYRASPISSPPITPSSLNQNLLSVSQTSRKNKRRSFLPILDGPPSINVPITVSPFMQSNHFPSHNSTPSTSSSSSAAAALISENFSTSPADEYPKAEPERSNDTPMPPTLTVDSSEALEEAEAAYAAGLKSVLAYLRDLWDLHLSSLPSVPHHLAQTPETDRPLSPPPSGLVRQRSHFGISEAGEGHEMRRAYSTVSVGSAMGSGSGGAESRVVSSVETSASSEEGTGPGGITYKEDKKKRARIIREIIE